MYEEGCADLLRELLKAESREASLRYKLFQLFEEARTETIRLSGMLSLCRAHGENVEEYYKILKALFERYLGMSFDGSAKSCR